MALITLNGINYQPKMLAMKILMMEEHFNLKNSLNEIDLTKQYWKDQKSTIEEGKRLLGPVLQQVQRQLALEVKKKPFTSTPSVVSTSKKSTVTASNQTTENEEAFRRHVLELVSQGQKAGEALNNAAVMFGKALSEGQKKYPHSFVHNYKKQLNK